MKRSVYQLFTALTASKRNSLVALLVATAMAGAGCSAIRQLTAQWKETNNILDETNKRLTEESSRWQQLLRETADQLRQKHQYELAEQVDGIVQRGIAAAGVEVRCSVDFLGTRVAQAFRHLVD